jgi:SOS-response transcriptional repressor LexA
MQDNVAIETQADRRERDRQRFIAALDRLRSMRDGLTDADVAKAVRSTGSSFSRWRSGTRPVNPHVLTLVEAELATWEAELQGAPVGAQVAGSAMSLPLAGKACTGERVAWDGGDMGMVDVRAGLVPEGRACVVEVGDRSMVPTLWEGDLVVVGLEMHPIVGDMVCVTDDEQGTLVRRLVSQGGGPLLVAEAGGFPSCEVGAHVVVHGVVTGIASRVFRV